MELETNKNNIEIKGELKLKVNVKRLDNTLIRIMLNTVVPLGYSYVCNDELNEGIIRFNKSVIKGTSKISLEKEVINSLLAHPSVEDFQVIDSQLCPVEMQGMSYHCPIPYVNKNILLEF